MDETYNKVLSDAKSSLERVQRFEARTLIRADDLGARFAFNDAVEPASKLIAFFQKLPSEALVNFPSEQLEKIQSETNSVYRIFDEILQFDNTVTDAAGDKERLTQDLRSRYQSVFNSIFPLISFAIARTVDFNETIAQGRAAVQTVKDETTKVLSEMEETSETAKKVLADVREAAAEQGVTQMARYFAEEADGHKEQSRHWGIGAILMSIIVLGYAVLTLFFTKIEILQANTTAEAIQLSISKVLIFFVLASTLIVTIRNFTAHKHNLIVNRHRQNALMTFKTLADAGNSVEARDAVLQHAAAAIYAPNDTGYVKNEERGYTNGSPLTLTTRVPSIGSGQDGS